jgi:hypothetical protein
MWLAAALAIQHCSENAEVEAARRDDLMLERAGLDGHQAIAKI